MLRTTALVIAAAAMLGTSAASAQVIDLGGRGGPSVDLRNDRQRERDYNREERRRARSADDGLSTGSVGNCKEITVREQDDDGRMVTRTTRKCR